MDVCTAERLSSPPPVSLCEVGEGSLSLTIRFVLHPWVIYPDERSTVQEMRDAPEWPHLVMKKWFVSVGCIIILLAAWAYAVTALDMNALQPGLHNVVFDVRLCALAETAFRYK